MAFAERKNTVYVPITEDEIQAVVDKHAKRYGGLIAVFHEIQSIHGYLPEEALRLVAKATGRSMVDVYGVATFYHSFSLKPRGKHHACVCVGTACHVRGAPNVVQEFEEQLGVDAGETTSDGEYSLEQKSCLGACALGPIVMVDDAYHSKMKPAMVKKLLDSMKTPAEEQEQEAEPMKSA